jgi:hypothetical protein
MRKASFVYIILACTLFSCIKPPSYSIIPNITFQSVSSPNAYSGYSDTITFTFTDGDGDIGINTSSTVDTGTVCNTCGIQHGDSSCLRLNAFNIFLIDSRDSCVSTFASANVQPTGKYKALSGNIQVIADVTQLKCFSCNSSCTTPDTVVYAIILRDMAGHFSNTIHTTPITIICPP